MGGFSPPSFWVFFEEQVIAQTVKAETFSRNIFYFLPVDIS